MFKSIIKLKRVVSKLKIFACTRTVSIILDTAEPVKILLDRYSTVILYYYSIIRLCYYKL